MGEHDWWAKNTSPWFQEVAHIQMWVWDPRVPEAAGTRRETLVQTIDVGVSLLDFFGLPLKDTMVGTPLRFAMEDSSHELHKIGGGLFGIFGAQVAAVDSSGQYVYMRAPRAAENSPLFEYTLMPTHMMSRFDVSELQDWECDDGYGFMKGCKVMKIKGRTLTPPQRSSRAVANQSTLLYDLGADASQLDPLAVI